MEPGCCPPVPANVRSQTLMLLEAADWQVGVPLTFWASAWWGMGTEWCTATDAPSFDIYHRRGPLIVFRACASGERWQLHPSTGEFRDAQNRKKSWRGFVGRNPDVLQALAGAFVRGLWGEVPGAYAGHVYPGAEVPAQVSV